MPSIVALLPAYNEEVSVGGMVLRTRQHADRVVMIDDGSRDNTAEVAARARAEAIRHSRNQGKGVALETGLGSVDGDSVIVTIDTDGQHSPDDIPRLVEPILSDVRQKDGRSFQCKGRAQEIPGYRQRRDERFLSHHKVRR